MRRMRGERGRGEREREGGAHDALHCLPLHTIHFSNRTHAPLYNAPPPSTQSTPPQWDPKSQRLLYSHVFETVEDDRLGRDDRATAALDAQIRAVEGLLDGLRRQRGGGGGGGAGASGGFGSGGGAAAGAGALSGSGGALGGSGSGSGAAGAAPGGGQPGGR